MVLFNAYPGGGDYKVVNTFSTGVNTSDRVGVAYDPIHNRLLIRDGVGKFYLVHLDDKGLPTSIVSVDMSKFSSIGVTTGCCGLASRGNYLYIYKDNKITEINFMNLDNPNLNNANTTSINGQSVHGNSFSFGVTNDLFVFPSSSDNLFHVYARDSGKLIKTVSESVDVHGIAIDEKNSLIAVQDIMRDKISIYDLGEEIPTCYNVGFDIDSPTNIQLPKEVRTGNKSVDISFNGVNISSEIKTDDNKVYYKCILYKEVEIE